MQVAYTLEQCWHRVPGGSATSALSVARALSADPDIELIGVAGRHRRPPEPSFVPNIPMRWLPVGRPLLYETWNRFGWPKVEAVTGLVDVCHSTVAIPAATDMATVVTIHDVAFVHTPERFTNRGVRVMTAGLERCRSVDVICCPSHTTRAALLELDFDSERISVVPWGVDAQPATAAELDQVRERYRLPSEFVLFVGTLEPRKNLDGLVNAMRSIDLPLVVAGAPGWGDAPERAVAVETADVRFIGFVPPDALGGLYAAATVFAYPSLEEGFGMPVLEAMAQGTPVVTSAGTATEEAAGGAGILVDPHDPESISAGIVAALADHDRLANSGRERARSATWEATAAATVEAYRRAIEHHRQGAQR